MNNAGFMTTGEFARKAGVSVRTLRYYDRLGLLKPRQRTEAGHRLYSQEDLVRLQQVMTLKFIGLPLNEIKSILDAPGFDLTHALATQRKIATEKARQMDIVAQAIDKALETLNRQQIDLEVFSGIIQAVQMENDKEWLKKYYTEDQLASLAQRQLSPEEQANVETEWQTLQSYAKKLAEENADPASEEAQQLAAKWQEMIEQFTGGDPGIAESLNNLWADRENVPMLANYFDSQVWEFMQKALEIYKVNK